MPIFPNDQFATFIMAATVGSFMVELVYVLLSVVAVKLVFEAGGAGVWWKLIVLLVAIATPILGFKGALWPSPHDSSNYNWVALYWSIGILVLAAIWLGICMVIRPDRVRQAAQHAAEDTAAYRPTTRSATGTLGQLDLDPPVDDANRKRLERLVGRPHHELARGRSELRPVAVADQHAVEQLAVLGQQAAGVRALVRQRVPRAGNPDQHEIDPGDALAVKMPVPRLLGRTDRVPRAHRGANLTCRCAGARNSQPA